MWAQSGRIDVSDALKYCVIEDAGSESGGLCPPRPHGLTGIRMMNEVTQKTASLFTSKCITDVLWKVLLNVLLLNVSCNDLLLVFFTPFAFVNSTFDPCGVATETCPVQHQKKGRARGHQVCFRPFP